MTLIDHPDVVGVARLAATGARAWWAEASDAVALADGTRLRLRPIDSGDRVAVAALFSRLGAESRYRRFLSPKSELTPRELSYLTDVDQVRHVAIAAVAEADGSIVAVSRYVQSSDRAGIAEGAIIVVDELHGMGIGTALAAHRVKRACANGLTHLTATTLWENRRARALSRRLGFRALTGDGHELEQQLELNCKARGELPQDIPVVATAHAALAGPRRPPSLHHIRHPDPPELTPGPPRAHQPKRTST
jgi:RimJ/RimL family protein N-acetyltransferase